MSWPERTFWVGMGVLLVASSFQKAIYMGGAMQRKGPATHVATPFGRVCFFVIGLMLIFVGLTGVTEFWYFKH